MKRLFDIILSIAGLILLSPMLLCIAWRIHRQDGGPVFFRGERVGKDGVPFRIFKFRTMVVNAEALGGSSTANEDPRVTRIGKTLRKYKLDELPQLLNVIVGHMSFVGPRPEVKRFTEMYTPEEKKILQVRPGITDWASIWNADEGSLLVGAEDPDQAYLNLIRPTKIRLQLQYVRESGLWADMKIILLTLMAIARPQSRTVHEVRRRLAVIT
jgi:lipopolysaccharide/colanic/teichoic acid biosynthesis glycosyltransferase